MSGSVSGSVSAEEIKALARSWFEEAWQQGTLDVVNDYYHADYIGHNPAAEIRGLESVKDIMRRYFAAFAELRFSVQDQIAEGDKVVTRLLMTGIHTGEFQGKAPTGRDVTRGGTVIFRIANGKIAEGWPRWDSL